MTTLSMFSKPGASARRRPRVLLLLGKYPQIGQTYIKNEIEALEEAYEIRIVARRGPHVGYDNHRPYSIAESMSEYLDILREFRPDVLHTHHLTELGFVGQLAEATGVPFTVRTHSSDVLALRRKGWRRRIGQMIRRQTPVERTPWFAQGARMMDSELCLGVLAFPCARPWLVAAGLNEKKLIDCFPVVRVAHFHDRSPNGDAVMNIGVATEKKAVPDFLRLARKVPDRRFSMYGMGYRTDALRAEAARLGAPVSFVDPVQPEAMPGEYKKHRWLVYTASARAPTIGWPMAIAEAQASGVGVCVPNLRPDLARYVGDGAGVLYDSIDELPGIIACPVPDEMRERGFAQAMKSDIDRHKHLLTDLWDAAVERRQPRLAAVPLASHAVAAAPLRVVSSL